MTQRQPRPTAQRPAPWGRAALLALPLWLAAPPAVASPPELITTDRLILAALALGLVVAFTLAALAFRRGRRPPPPGLSRTELEEMHRAVTAFAGLLREGSAMLLQQQRETLDAVERVAAHSQQLIALIAGCEERMTNATAQSEILAARVARSAAVEVKASVESLTAISARIEYQARALEEATRPGGARAA